MIKKISLPFLPAEFRSNSFEVANQLRERVVAIAPNQRMQWSGIRIESVFQRRFRDRSTQYQKAPSRLFHRKLICSALLTTNRNGIMAPNRPAIDACDRVVYAVSAPLRIFQYFLGRYCPTRLRPVGRVGAPRTALAIEVNRRYPGIRRLGSCNGCGTTARLSSQLPDHC